MPGRRHETDEIINKLRHAEVKIGRGKSMAEVCRLLEVTEATYYRWRRDYGGMPTSQAMRLRELERENARLKRLLAESELDKAILRVAASGNF